MPAGKPPMAPTPTDDDELDDLPPIDGDDVDEAEAPPDELDDEGLEADGGDPFDDSTGETDPVGEEELDVGGDESGWLDDAGDAEQLDVGTPETFGEEEGAALLEGAEELEAEEEEDLGFGEEPTGAADAGEEGFEEDDEDLREEDLPRLDSGADDVETGDEDLGDGLPDDDTAEEPRPPWADRAWERADGDVGGLAAVEALACTPEGLVVGGQGLARVDAKGAVTVLEAAGLRGGAPSAIAAGPAALAVATPRAGVLVSRDGGRSFTEANGWRRLVAGDDAVVDLAPLGGELWGRTRAGALVWSADLGGTWSRVEERRFDGLAIDAERREAVVVARDAAGSVVGRGAGGTLALEPAGALPGGRFVGIAARGGRLALGIAGRGAFRMTDGTWARADGTASLTALVFGRGGALLVALASDAEARAWIALAPEEGPVTVVAELGEPAGVARPVTGEDWVDDEDRARVRALAWDDAPGVLWGAGGFGLVALRASRR